MSTQDKNKIIPDFKDISVSSLIYDLPTVINYNNGISTQCFKNIFNFDKEYLTKPVKTSGNISGNTGEFKNLILLYGTNSKLTIDASTILTITELKKENKELKQQINDISLKIENLLSELKNR